MTSTVLVFVLGAIAINLLIYGGIAWVYFRGERRVDPPRQHPPVRLEAQPGARVDDDHEPRAAA